MPPQDPAALTADELRVVALLADGRTDDAAATHLGCTARTIRRRVSDAMAKLGARSRLQLGVELCRRDLLGSATGHAAGNAQTGTNVDRVRGSARLPAEGR